MEKIAVLSCSKVNSICGYGGCLSAWNAKRGTFDRYSGADAELGAMLRCDGCGSHPETDESMQRKLDRAIANGVTAVHLGHCTMKGRPGEAQTMCPTIVKIEAMLRERGIQVIFGTHPTRRPDAAPAQSRPGA